MIEGDGASGVPLNPAGAIFSPCQRYRYVLWRRWIYARPVILFIGLNPSTADATVNDPTIRRCMGFAQSWGYGGIVVTNLFAYRATKPPQLRQAIAPVGPDTDAWIVQLCQCLTQPTPKHPVPAEKVVAIWGNGGAWQGRDRAVLDLLQPVLPRLHCLRVTKKGQPAHPLYLPKTAQLQPYPGTFTHPQP